MSRSPETQLPPDVHGKLVVTGRFKAKFAELFDRGSFEPDTQAILEFIDNAVTARDRKTGKTRILVSASPDKLRVAAFDEKGMGPEEVLAVFHLGETGLSEEEIGLNTKGSGFKLATFHLANHLEYLKAKRPGSKFQHITSLLGLGDEAVDYSGDVTVISELTETVYENIGMVDIGLRGMKWRKPPAPVKLARSIGIAYGPILVEEDGKWTYQSVSEKGRARKALDQNGNLVEVKDRVQIFVHSVVGKTTIQAKPPEIHYRDDAPIIDSVVVRTSEGEPLAITAGVLDLTKVTPSERQRDKSAGGHLSYDGRIVERGLIPQDQEMRDTRVRERLRWTADITQVRGIKDKLEMNKSNGVRGGPEKDRIMKAVVPVLLPLIEAIKSLDAPSIGLTSSHFRDQLNLGRKFADAALRKMIETGEIDLDVTLVAGVLSEIRNAQERPRGAGENKKDSKLRGISGTPWKEQEARTLPTTGADPKIPRRRLTPYQIRTKSLDDQVTSTITVEAGKAYLDINDNHPLNQFYEFIDGLDASAGSLAAAMLGSVEEVRHLARELSGGDLEKETTIEQALLWISGKMLAEEPTWKFLKDKSRQTVAVRQKKKK